MSIIQKTSASGNGTLTPPALTGVASGTSSLLFLLSGQGMADVLPVSSGQTWTKVTFNSGGVAPIPQVAAYVLLSPNFGAHTLTEGNSSGGSFIHYSLLEIPRCSSIDAVGTFVAANGNPTTQTAGITNIAAACAVVGLFTVDTSTGQTNQGISDPPTTPGGWSSISAEQNSTAFITGAHCYKEVSAAAAQSATWTFNADATSQNACSILFSLQFAALTPTTLPFPQQTAAVGSTATYSPSYTNTPTSYQWSKNGTPISGATSASYTTPTIVASDNGALFSVVATNAAGSSPAVGAYLFVQDIKTGRGLLLGGSAWTYRSERRLPGAMAALRKQFYYGNDPGGAYTGWADFWLPAISGYIAAQTESGTAADSASSSTVQSATITEAASGADGSSSATVQATAQSESASAADTSGASVSATSAISETASGSDASSATMAATQAIAESGTASDAPSASLTSSATAAESGTAADTSTGLLSGNFAGSVAESGTASDSSSSATSKTATIAESGTAADSATEGMAAQVAIAEAATGSDSSASSLASTASASEGGTAADAPTSTVASTASIAEAGTAASTAAAAMGATPAITEAASAADASTGAMQSSAAQAESGNAADVSATGAIIPATISESGTATEASISASASQASIAEAGTASHAQTVAMSASVAASESASAADTPTGSRQTSASVSENGSAVDVPIGGVSLYAVLAEVGFALDAVIVLSVTQSTPGDRWIVDARSAKWIADPRSTRFQVQARATAWRPHSR